MDFLVWMKAVGLQAWGICSCNVSTIFADKSSLKYISGGAYCVKS